MKFKKLDLDESLFDDSTVHSVPVTHTVVYDDDFSAPEYMPSTDTAVEGPKEGSDTGVADLLIDAINDEWDAIRKYNSLVATLRAELQNNPQYDAFIHIIEDIAAEENRHVGQLQEALRQISPNASQIESGKAEGRSQFNFTNGLLQVQSWDVAPQQASTSDMLTGAEPCSVTDVDDDM